MEQASPERFHHHFEPPSFSTPLVEASHSPQVELESISDYLCEFEHSTEDVDEEGYVNRFISSICGCKRVKGSPSSPQLT